jgi:hypothetical protein
MTVLHASSMGQYLAISQRRTGQVPAIGAFLLINELHELRVHGHPGQAWRGRRSQHAAMLARTAACRRSLAATGAGMCRRMS